MHDLHAADKVLKMALEGAKANGLSKITQIEVELGTVVEHGSEIVPENLRFNVESLARASIAAGAKVIIKKTAGNQVVLKSIEGDK